MFATISMVLMLGMAALAVDGGMLYLARGELQKSADAAALAGAYQLLDDRRLAGAIAQNNVFADSRASASTYGAANKVLGNAPEVDPDGDITLGFLSDLKSRNEAMSFTNPNDFNAVEVIVRRNDVRNGPINLIFANVFGNSSANVGASATAAFFPGIVGYRVTDSTGNAELLPFALIDSAWTGLLTGQWTTGDHYSYDKATGTVTPGSDGIPELNLYPGAGPTQLPPGNYGTVDIGSQNNSSADIARQIVYGVNQSDLDALGGELMIPSWLNGDTGLSAGFKDELTSIIGLPRAIPIFDELGGGNGNNSQYHIVRFGGIRIMHVKLTGPMTKKEVIIQPAYVVDDAAISEPNDTSDFVFQPVRLVR